MHFFGTGDAGGLHQYLRSQRGALLPLPIPPDTAADALRFYDLSDYPGLFLALANAVFPMPERPVAAAGAGDELEVHRVGDYDASFVPKRADFERLDRRFRLDDAVWRALPQYADWGFAVFQLRAPKAATEFHPMAFSFPRRDPSRLFFPTIHVHDARVHATARFAHQLYYQVLAQDGPLPNGMQFAQLPTSSYPDDAELDLQQLHTPPPDHWVATRAPAGDFVDIRRSCGIIDSERRVYGRALFGEYPNCDTTVEDPRGI